MPTSAAPIGLPPVAIVWRPQRVFLSTNCSTSASTTAQAISAIALAPNAAVKPGPACGWTGKPPEIVSVKPLMRKSMPERRDEGRQPEQRGDGAVDQPDDAGGEQADDHREPDRQAGCRSEIHHERRQRVDHADGQVQFAAHEHEHLAGGDDGGGRGELDEVAEIGPGEEGGAGELEIDHQQDAGDQDAGLAVAQQRISEARGQAARCRRRPASGRASARPSSFRSSAVAQPPIGPERSTSFCFLALPSKRLCVWRYGLTELFVTNFRPVLISAGPVRPPDILKRNISITV